MAVRSRCRYYAPGATDGHHRCARACMQIDVVNRLKPISPIRVRCFFPLFPTDLHVTMTAPNQPIGESGGM